MAFRELRRFFRQQLACRRDRSAAQGWDKTYCLRFVKDDFDEIHFFGDKTFEVGRAGRRSDGWGGGRQTCNSVREAQRVLLLLGRPVLAQHVLRVLSAGRQ